jgi:diguanylate cyclase (GGDEF)-like protein
MENSAKKVLLVGIIIAIVFWFFDASVDVFIFEHGSLRDVLLTPDLRTVWKRIVIMALIVGMSLYARRHIIELDIMRAELKGLATTDSLTGAYNRAKFEEIIELEIERAKRFIHPLSILMFDIDNFKGVNDTYGHAVGDEVLKEFTGIARAHTRKINHLIRWGGDEFIIVPVETTLSGAVILSKRLRGAIEDFDFTKAGSVTASFGVAQYREEDTKETLLKRLDDALYKAKGGGGNKVESVE